MRFWRWARPPIAFTAAAVLLGLSAWQIGRWDDTGDGTCGPLYRPDIWRSSEYCLHRTTPRLALVLLGVAVAIALGILAIRSLLAESSP